MSAMAGKTYWLIGASEGLGRALAQKLDREGVNLILSARNCERLTALADQLSNARAMPLDVTDHVALRHVFSEIGDIDGLIYNAGAYEPMRATKWDQDAALRMVDVNFTGAMRVLGEVIPGMVERKSGNLTLIGSLAGYRGLPGAVGYGASKAALMSLAETLRFDLKNSGVTVRIVNPGFIRTRLTQKNDFKMPMLMEPDEAAERVLKAMQRTRFRTDFPVPFSWVIRFIECLPDWVIYRFG